MSQYKFVFNPYYIYIGFKTLYGIHFAIVDTLFKRLSIKDIKHMKRVHCKIKQPIPTNEQD